MDKTEALADMVIKAVSGLVERRVQALTDELAALRAELAVKAAALPTLDDARSILRSMVDELPRPQDGAPGERGMSGERGAPGERGLPGESVHQDTLRLWIGDEVAKSFDKLRIPKDGAPGDRGEKGEPGIQGAPGQVDMIEVRRMIGEAVSAMPKAENGKDGAPGERGADGTPGENGKDGAPGARGADGAPGENGKDGTPGARGADGAPGQRGADGKSIDIEEVRAMVNDFVVREMAAIPRPKDGERGERGEVGERGMPGDRGIDGKDADLGVLRDIVGIAVKAAISEVPMPQVDMGDIERFCETAAQKAVAAVPVPRDGKDGFGLEDFEVDLKDDGRTLVLRFERGEQEKTFEIICPWQIYRGVWTAGRYQKGDVVTYAGSSWTALSDTTETPGKSSAWQLSVKRGKDAA